MLSLIPVCQGDGQFNMKRIVVAMFLVTTAWVVAAQEVATPENKLPEGFLGLRSASPAIAVCEGPLTTEVVVCRSGTDRLIIGQTTVYAMASQGWRLVSVVSLSNHAMLKYFFQK